LLSRPILSQRVQEKRVNPLSNNTELFRN
jgi:hypothetical protein